MNGEVILESFKQRIALLLEEGLSEEVLQK
jgi:hypothetical protein